MLRPSIATFPTPITLFPFLPFTAAIPTNAAASPKKTQNPPAMPLAVGKTHSKLDKT